VVILLENTGYESVKVFFPFFMYQCSPVLDGKDKLDVQLGISIWHKNLFTGKTFPVN